MPVGRQSAIRKGGGTGFSARGQRGGTRSQRNGQATRDRFTDVALTALDIELHTNDGGAEGQIARFLACPFYKKDPLRHLGCMSLVLANVTRVKQHLNRRHGIPPYCPTCGETFLDNDSCDKHVRGRKCEEPPKGVEKPEGIDPIQRAKLARRVSRTLGVQDQWFQVYHILFGDGAPRPLSAFLGDPVDEVMAIAQKVWDEDRPAIIAKVLPNVESGPDAHSLFAKAVVKELIERTRSLASQSSQGTIISTAPRGSTATVDSQATQAEAEIDSQLVKSEPGPSQTDRHPSVPVDPALFDMSFGHQQSPKDTPLGMAAVASAEYGTDPMAVDPPMPSPELGYLTQLSMSPSP